MRIVLLGNCSQLITTHDGEEFFLVTCFCCSHSLTLGLPSSHLLSGFPSTDSKDRASPWTRPYSLCSSPSVHCFGKSGKIHTLRCFVALIHVLSKEFQDRQFLAILECGQRSQELVNVSNFVNVSRLNPALLRIIYNAAEAGMSSV